MSLERKQLVELAQVRVAVGLLGEQSPPRWWNSSFCGNNGKAFLSPIFPRTYVHAQYQGVVSAAGVVHDDRIGIGNVFHLFRLPEEIEQMLHSITKDCDISAVIANVMKDTESAKQFLLHYSDKAQKFAEGPVKVGQLMTLKEFNIWRVVAAYYLNAFEHNKATFPFFSDKA